MHWCCSQWIEALRLDKARRISSLCIRQVDKSDERQLCQMSSRRIMSRLTYHEAKKVKVEREKTGAEAKYVLLIFLRHFH
jgi:hypothetical protein